MTGAICELVFRVVQFGGRRVLGVKGREGGLSLRGGGDGWRGWVEGMGGGGGGRGGDVEGTKFGI